MFVARNGRGSSPTRRSGGCCWRWRRPAPAAAPCASIATRFGRRSLLRLAAWAIALVTLGGRADARRVEARLLLPTNWGELASGISAGDPGDRGGPPSVSREATRGSGWHGPRRSGRDRRGRRRGVLARSPPRAPPARRARHPGGHLRGRHQPRPPGGRPDPRRACCWRSRRAGSGSPGCGGSQRAQALALSVAAGIVALPIAARLDSGPLLDYESWDIFGSASDVSFEWDHTYGPLDWPREGATMLTVHSETPLYWKASVLDRFDGFSWQRAKTADPLAVVERQARYETPKGVLRGRHPEWLTSVRFEVDGLESPFVTGDRGHGGHARARGAEQERGRDADQPRRPGDRRLRVLDHRLCPAPDAERAERGARDAIPAQRFGEATAIGLPSSLAPGYAVSMPLWGTRDPDAAGADAGLSVRRHLSARAFVDGGGPDPVRGGPLDRGPPAPGVRLRPERAPPHLPARFVPVRGPRRLLPAVRRVDGADAPDDRDPEPGGRRLRPRHPAVRRGHVPGPRHRRPFLGRGLLPRHRLGDLRPHAGRRPRRLAEPARRARAGPAARRRSPPSRRAAPAAAPKPRPRPGWRPVRRRRRSVALDRACRRCRASPPSRRSGRWRSSAAAERWRPGTSPTGR